MTDTPLDPGWNATDMNPLPETEAFLGFFPNHYPGWQRMVVSKAVVDLEGKVLRPPTHWRPLPK